MGAWELIRLGESWTKLLIIYLSSAPHYKTCSDGNTLKADLQLLASHCLCKITRLSNSALTDIQSSSEYSETTWTFWLDNRRQQWPNITVQCQVCPSQATHALVAVAAMRVMQLPPVASVQTVLQKDQEPYSATETTISGWPSSSNGLLWPQYFARRKVRFDETQTREKA